MYEKRALYWLWIVDFPISDREDDLITIMNTLLPPTIQYNEYSISVLGTYADAWICADDVCKILSYKKSGRRQAIDRHVHRNDKKTWKELVLKFNYPVIIGNYLVSYYINELGLMDLLYSCRLRPAKAFKIFITREFASMKSKIPVDEDDDETSRSLSNERIDHHMDDVPIDSADDDKESSGESSCDSRLIVENEMLTSENEMLQIENEMLKRKLQSCKDIIQSKNEIIKLLEERILKSN